MISGEIRKAEFIKFSSWSKSSTTDVVVQRYIFRGLPWDVRSPTAGKAEQYG